MQRNAKVFGWLRVVSRGPEQQSTCGMRYPKVSGQFAPGGSLSRRDAGRARHIVSYPQEAGTF
jgi:hypothetical protein